MGHTYAVADRRTPVVKETIVRFLKEGGCSQQFDARSHCLQGIELMNVSLPGANVSQADISQANLCGINLSQANVRDADLHATALCWADLRYADLSGADLHDADLSWADLRHANLQGSRLDGALLTGADLSAANLRDLCLDVTDLQHGATASEQDGSLRQRLQRRGAILHEPCCLQVVDPPNEEVTSYRWGFALGFLLMSVISGLGVLMKRNASRPS